MPAAAVSTGCRNDCTLLEPPVQASTAAGPDSGASKQVAAITAESLCPSAVSALQSTPGASTSLRSSLPGCASATCAANCDRSGTDRCQQLRAQCMSASGAVALHGRACVRAPSSKSSLAFDCALLCTGCSVSSAIGAAAAGASGATTDLIEWWIVSLRLTPARREQVHELFGVHSAQMKTASMSRMQPTISACDARA